jgi:cellulose synthase/poly-beta-1,6-N-acetylglucosamine synthase-like glycosyltransferase
MLVIMLFYLAVFLATGYALLILCYRSFWTSAKKIKTDFDIVVESKLPFISIIVPARNEEANIGLLLTSLQNQTYNQSLFEIIVVDDFSEDKTASVVKTFSGGNVHYVALKDIIGNVSLNSYKKKAIEAGISHAKGELIVTTDADCVAENKWVQTIAHFYSKNKPDMMVMPVVMSREKTFLELFQQLDFMSLQGITGGLVSKGFYQMCNGANLAYTKAVFQRVNGFKDIDNIASGDDMLLLQKIAKDKNNKIEYLKAKEVIIKTAPVENWYAFLQQRIRWAGKAGQYIDSRLFPVLLGVYGFNFMLAFLFFAGCFHATHCPFFCWNLSAWELLGYLILMKVVVELYFLIPVADFFGKRKLLWIFPLMQPFHILYTLVAGWLGKFGKYKWKSRTVK